MRIKNALVYTVEHGFVERDVRIKNGCFAGSEAAGTDGEEILDAGGDYLIPGLVDIHFHGCAGHDFSDGTPEALQAIGAYELRQGVTSICPASMTLSEETLKTVCANAYAYTKRPEAEQDTGARLIGIHLEGPFISMEKKGAQNPAYIRNPDVEMFLRLQEAAHGLVRLITIAPETDGAKEFIRRLADQVHISVGHTCSDYETAYRAFSQGADHGPDRGWAAWRSVCRGKAILHKDLRPQGSSGICRFDGREKGYYCFSRKRTRELSGDQRNPISVRRQKNSTGGAGWRNTRISLLIYSMKN